MNPVRTCGQCAKPLAAGSNGCDKCDSAQPEVVRVVEVDFLAAARRKREERERERAERDEELARIARAVGPRRASITPSASPVPSPPSSRSPVVSPRRTSSGRARLTTSRPSSPIVSPRFEDRRQSLVMMPSLNSSSGSNSEDEDVEEDDQSDTGDEDLVEHRRVSQAEVSGVFMLPPVVPPLQLSSSGTPNRGARRLSRSDVIPVLRQSQSEQSLTSAGGGGLLPLPELKSVNLSQPDMPLSRPSRERSQSITAVPHAGSSDAVSSAQTSRTATTTKKAPLTRSLSQRIRRIASPAGDLVSDTNISTSWLAPKPVSPRSKRSTPSSPRRVTSPRKGSTSARWPWAGGGSGSGHSSSGPAVLAKVAGFVLMLNSAQKWSKRWCRICDNTLEVFHRDKVSGKPSSTPKRLINLGGSLTRAEPEKLVMGKPFVLEMVSMSDGPVVMAFSSLPELQKWTTIVADAAANREAGAAFPGIRMIEVQEEADDATWKSLVARAEGWRVELSSTPVDVTFATSWREHSEYGRYFGESPHSAWVGVSGQDGEIFVALIAHADDFSRMLVRTKVNDRLMEFVSTKSDARLLKKLDDAAELYPVHNLACLRELDAIGGQDMSEFTTFKFGVVYAKKGWSEQEMFENCQVSADFEEFVGGLGTRVALEGFKRFAGGLDVGPGGAARSGEHGLFVEYRSTEIMLHVAPWIPLMREQSSRVVQRKRHIANDVCVIVYCDDGEGPFLPSLIKTKFVHVYIVVSKDKQLSAAAGKTLYRVATVLRKGMPSFGPRLVRPPVYEQGPAFRDFLMAKCINGEKASKFAPDFLRQRAELRGWFLQKLLDESKRAK